MTWLSRQTCGDWDMPQTFGGKARDRSGEHRVADTDRAGEHDRRGGVQGAGAAGNSRSSQARHVPVVEVLAQSLLQRGGGGQPAVAGAAGRRPATGR